VIDPGEAARDAIQQIDKPAICRVEGQHRLETSHFKPRSLRPEMSRSTAPLRTQSSRRFPAPESAER
jgi:hypothetical protein